MRGAAVTVAKGQTHVSEIIKGMQLRAQTAVDAEELLVHNSRQREAAERLNTGVIYGLRVLVLAFKLEREVVRQVATFMVSSEKP